MDNLTPDDGPFTPTVLPEATAFEPVLSRIDVPRGPQYPDGQAVCIQLYTVIGGPLVFIMPPASARDIGNGLIETAGMADGFVIPGDGDIKRFLNGT